MADDSRRRVRRRRPGAPKPADPTEAGRSAPESAAKADRKPPPKPDRKPPPKPDRKPPPKPDRTAAKPDRTAAKPDRKPPAESRPERSLRGLVGPGPTQVSVSAATRARDAARPGPEDIAAAERDLSIVRRHYRPEEASPPRRNRKR